MDGTTGDELILAGDFGGTKTNFGLFAGEPGRLRPVRLESFPTRDAASAVLLIERFLAAGESGPIAEACFGVAAPVIGGTAAMVNLPWVIEADVILRHFGFRRVLLINDLVATAAAVPHLRPDQFERLTPAEAAPGGNIGLIAAGTGLGEALLVWDGRDYLPASSEGGHKDFAPRDERQWRLRQFLARHYGPHVSVERVLSGPGLAQLYHFLREESGEPETDWLSQRFMGADPAQIIAEAALAGEDRICREALALFVEIYGAEAGNLALQGLTLGGIYIAGGIAPKIREALLAGPFMAAFAAKGRMASLLGKMPVRLITDPLAPLWGAAAYGRKAAALTPA
ncbi:MAG: glucokinase [Desulfobacteraceae bacterium]|nr:glucokinase [Desulfobacteraceae bacterium]